MRHLPRSFAAFLRANGISSAWYEAQLEASQSVPRHVWLGRMSAARWSHQTRMDLSRERLCEALRDKCVDFLEAQGGEPLAWAGRWDLGEQVWALPVDTRISKNELYNAGVFMGVDAASVLAVDALDLRPGHAALDLCCAPGAKLSIMADRLAHEGALVGVDACGERSTACAGLARRRRLGAAGQQIHRSPPWLSKVRNSKADNNNPIAIAAQAVRRQNQLQNSTQSQNQAQGIHVQAVEEEKVQETPTWLFQLRCQDGTKKVGSEGYIVWDSAADEVMYDLRASRQRGMEIELDDVMSVFVQKPRPRLHARLRSRVEALRADVVLPTQFDRVLVDAQCSHEGSVRHVLKHLIADERGNDNHPSSWSPQVLDHLYGEWLEKADVLEDLQRKLILNGFDSLRPGGRMVYSTCSFAEAQNEAIVEYLLRERPDAECVPVGFDVPGRQSKRLPSAWIMDPLTSQTSGLFLVAIVKKEQGSLDAHL